ncbi:MAG TPA: integrase [Flavobacteriaceae bacterium]|nr:tyrosine-type recombinase/integrase [Ulvibacter sp.]HAH34506.1 integrase [Flavobacteriaceae bacterium]|tara:strand:+ start:180 stop:1070 length:891 start_codon:yes stop_codon:yes gene_type:complete
MPFKPFTDYLLLEKKYSPHTVAAYSKDIQRFFDFVSKEYQLKSLLVVNYSMVRSWIVYLVDSGISNSSINRKISSLKTYYKFLLKTSQISETPLAKHRALKVAKKIQIPFSQTEVEDVLELFDHANDFQTLRDKLIVELFYSTGIRRAELIGLRLSDVSEVQKTIKVLGKRNKERIIPLLPSVLTTIARYKTFRAVLPSLGASKILLVTSKGNAIYETLVYRVITRYFSEISLKVKKSPHILRHSFATHLLSQGAELTAVKELLGHASLASTQVYTHNSIDTLKQVYKNTHPRNSK